MIDHSRNRRANQRQMFRANRFEANIPLAIGAILVFGAWLALPPGAAWAQKSMRASLRTPATGVPVYDGFTRPIRSIMLSADEIGRLKSVNVLMGQRVAAGEVVAELEDGLQAVAVEIAELQSRMEGERDAAVAEAERVRVRTDKLIELALKGMARPDELSRSRTDLKVANARVKSLSEQLRLRAHEFERAKVLLSRRKIRAPFAGIISEVLMQPGEYLSPSSPAIVELLVVDQIKAVFNVPVEELEGIAVGAVVHIRSMGSSSAGNAPIVAISPKIDDRSGTVEIHAVIDNADGNWLAGDRCTVQRTVAPTEQARISNRESKLRLKGANR